MNYVVHDRGVYFIYYIYLNCRSLIDIIEYCNLQMKSKIHKIFKKYWTIQIDLLLTSKDRVLYLANVYKGHCLM